MKDNKGEKVIMNTSAVLAAVAVRLTISIQSHSRQLINVFISEGTREEEERGEQLI